MGAWLLNHGEACFFAAVVIVCYLIGVLYSGTWFLFRRSWW